jgi:glyoxylase-like metal-dependent hydrolase (beta-lactamase superfamily II)
MIVEVHPVGLLQCNCIIWGDPEAGTAVVIDPGGDPDPIRARVDELGLRGTAIIHTHCHFDHTWGSAGLHDLTGAPVGIHAGDQYLLDGYADQLSWIPVPLPEPPPPPVVNRELEEGDRIECGAHPLEVLHTPGHTPGSISFLGEDPTGPLLCSGDTLFLGGIGRTDFPGGDSQLIERSIRTRLYELPPETRVIPGHGPMTTIEQERTGNPFVRA